MRERERGIRGEREREHEKSEGESERKRGAKYSTTSSSSYTLCLLRVAAAAGRAQVYFKVVQFLAFLHICRRSFLSSASLPLPPSLIHFSRPRGRLHNRPLFTCPGPNLPVHTRRTLTSRGCCCCCYCDRCFVNHR